MSKHHVPNTDKGGTQRQSEPIHRQADQEPTVVKPEPVKEAPEKIYSVSLSASQVSALQDILSGKVRVPGTTGATPVHDDDSGVGAALVAALGVDTKKA